MLRGTVSSLLAGLLLFASAPSTSNYKLNSFGFGGGGQANTTTSNYALEGITGEVSGQTQTTTTYQQEPGYVQTQQANVPYVTLTNTGNYYDKLHFVLDQQNNPADALYALKVVTTNTTCTSPSATYYVQTDDTLGAALTTAQYQTYTNWGGSSGANIIGLTAGTTYCMFSKATQGKFTESAWGPSSSAATVGQQISFCVYTGGSCVGSTNSINFGSLLANTVASSSNIGIDFATNADSGGNVYIYSANGGLRSTAAGFTLSSSTADLSSASSGFGAQETSVSQTSGGPLNELSPYNGTGNNVGALGTSITTLLTSTSPLVGGSAVFQLKAKPSAITPEAPDYAETITVIAAAAF